MSKKGVFLINNTLNNKKYVGISHDIENEWFKLKRDLKSGLGPKKMKDDYRYMGEEYFQFSIELISDVYQELNRKESEIAYKYNVWANGYNEKQLLNYRSMSEEKLADLKLRFYKFIESIDDGKYMMLDLLRIFELSKNDMEVLLNEISDEEMQYFKKRVTLKNKQMGLLNYYMEVRSITESIRSNA